MARILVVEDDDDARDLFEFALRARGFEVSTTDDGKAALDRCHTFSPHVIVIDIFLPRVDGIAVIRELRAAASTVKIVAISAGWNVANLEINDDLVERDVLGVALAAGADRTLQKPLAPKDLVAAVESLLPRS